MLAQVDADTDHGLIAQADIGPIDGYFLAALGGANPLVPAGFKGMHVICHLGSIVWVRIDLIHEIAVVGVVTGPAQHRLGVPVQGEALQVRIPHHQQDGNVIKGALQQLLLLSHRCLGQLRLGDIFDNADEPSGRAVGREFEPDRDFDPAPFAVVAPANPAGKTKKPIPLHWSS